VRFDGRERFGILLLIRQAGGGECHWPLQNMTGKEKKNWI
jgi:hypothetical protein